MGTQTRLDDKARLAIPAHMRRELGFREGDTVLLEPLGPGQFRVTRLETKIKEARGMFRHLKGPGEDITSELIAERRREAVAEGNQND